MTDSGLTTAGMAVPLQLDPDVSGVLLDFEGMEPILYRRVLHLLTYHPPIVAPMPVMRQHDRALVSHPMRQSDSHGATHARPRQSKVYHHVKHNAPRIGMPAVQRVQPFDNQNLRLYGFDQTTVFLQGEDIPVQFQTPNVHKRVIEYEHWPVGNMLRPN